jgi:hypothetical protein
MGGTMRHYKTAIGFGLALLVLATSLMALPDEQHKIKNSQSSLIIDTQTYFDINRLLCFVYNDGNFAYDNANVLGKTDGLYFPRGTKKTVIYAAGLWIAAQVDGDIHAAAAEYSSEYVQGPMENGTYLPDSPDFRVYKISRGDQPWSNEDYANWPSDMGAPVDDFGNPRLSGDQMCWSVFNDANPVKHDTDVIGTEPLGVEVQHTSFAYGRSSVAGQMIFMKWLVINKGTDTFENTYITLWCDPDLGDNVDDLTGCDTTMALGYCYNGADSDAIYGSAPPAVGFVFLQGPLVDGQPTDSGKFLDNWYYGKKNLPMTAFTKSTNGNSPDNAMQIYNCMEGLWPFGNPMVDPEGDTTKFCCAGDPVADTGWLDQYPAERRFMISSGPFDMMPGDSQEVVAAIVVGQGADRLTSISLLRAAAQYAKGVYDMDYDLSLMTGCGDANGDGTVNVSDAVFIINYLYVEGMVPTPLRIGDVNCNGDVDISDVIYIINYVFIGGYPPCDIDGSGNPDC